MAVRNGLYREGMPAQYDGINTRAPDRSGRGSATEVSFTPEAALVSAYLQAIDSALTI